MRQVCVEDNVDLPRVITIDEVDMFSEIRDFLITAKKWSVDLEWYANFDMLKCCVSQLDSIVRVKDLNERNRAEPERIGFKEDEFAFEAESYARNVPKGSLRIKPVRLLESRRSRYPSRF